MQYFKMRIKNIYGNMAFDKHLLPHLLIGLHVRDLFAGLF